MKLIVHVTTLEQWKSVLNIWFNQGHHWASGKADGYDEGKFRSMNGRHLGLNISDDNCISFWSDYTCDYPNKEDYLVEYDAFMLQQTGVGKMKTYYVTEEQLSLIKELKSKSFPIDFLALNSDGYFSPLAIRLSKECASALLRYLGGDDSIEFKVKEPLYRLWRIDLANDTIYMKINDAGTPDWTRVKDVAFTAPLEEIKMWDNPAWSIEEVK